MEASTSATDRIPWHEWPENLWGYGLTTGGSAFCVHALLTDGLVVTPFDRHSGGDGRLRAAGMTVELWRRWFERTVNEDVNCAAEMAWPAWRRSPEWPPSREILHAEGRPPRTPQELWDGPESVLAELTSTSPPRLAGTQTSHVMTARSRSGHPDPLWDELQRFRGRVPHFWIYVVKYPSIVTDVIPPAAIVMGDRVLSNPIIYRGMLMGALERLAQEQT